MRRKQYSRQTLNKNGADFPYTDATAWARMSRMKTKPIFLAMACSGVVALSLLAPAFSTGQTAPAVQTGTNPRALATLLKEVQEQQKTIADNQAKIDEKVTATAETIRQARIFVTRGGR